MKNQTHRFLRMSTFGEKGYFRKTDKNQKNKEKHSRFFDTNGTDPTDATDAPKEQGNEH
ncbi:MAG: hypothetical protein IKH86_06060 [Prevotella sp.]|nr:hypothetical protein [Prevotella sp.]